MAVNTWDDPRVSRGVKAQLAERGRRMSAGQKPIGWKIAFGAPDAVEELGTNGPMVGFMTDRSVLESGQSYSIAGMTKPGLEPEIAIHIGRDIEPGSDLATVREAISGLGAAIEIADVNQPRVKLEAVLAGNIYHRGVILGPVRTERAGGNLEGIEGRVAVNGEPLHEQPDPEKLLGDIASLAQYVAEFVSASGERARAGEVIISGSLTPIVFPAAGDRVEVEISELGGLSISFTE